MTELLVVVAIIALLLALVLVGFRKAKLLARVAGCLSNQRQITLAQASYATDNGGALASPRTSFSGGTTSFTFTNPCGSFSFFMNNGNTSNESYHSWTASYGSSVVAGSEKEFKINSTDPNAKALSGGRLFSYIGSIPVYKSPLDPTDRLRSYSFNACLGVTRPDELADYDTPFMNPATGVSVPLSIYNTTTIATVKQPSRMMSTLVEDDNVAWNNEGWIISPQPSTRLWVDLPAPWRPEADRRPREGDRPRPW